jgi:hypothetical protein
MPANVFLDADVKENTPIIKQKNPEELRPLYYSTCNKKSGNLLDKEVSENRRGISCTVSQNKKSIDLNEMKGRVPLSVSNVNSLSAKRKITLSTNADCDKPVTAGEVKNLYQAEFRYECIEDQLKNLNNSKRTYRYEQLLSRVKKNSSRADPNRLVYQ